MIYLIDDNQNDQRKSLYKINYVDNGGFKDILVCLDKISKSFNLASLIKAKCILLHSTTEDVNEEGSFIPGSRTNAIKIKEVISKEGDLIPLVLFSNGMSENASFDYQDNPNYISAIKKNKFYGNLFPFLTNYKSSGLIDLRIIAFGKNYKSIEVGKYGNRILNEINRFDENNPFSPSLLENVSDLESFYSISHSSDFTDFIHGIEMNSISIGEFKKNIKAIIESYIQYNENIYDRRQ